MSMLADFELAWKPFEDKLNSFLVNSVANNELVDDESFRSFYAQALRAWEDPSKVQCGFLSKWSAAAPAFENNFLAILRGFKVEVPPDIEKPSVALYIGGTCLATVLGALIGVLMPKTSFLKAHFGTGPVILIGAALFTAIGGGIVKSLYENKVREVCKNSTRQYTEQIEQLYTMLQNFCRQFT